MTTLWRAEECGKSKLTLHLVTHPSFSLNDLFCLLFLSLVFLVFFYMLSPTRMPFIPLIFFLIYSPITLLLLHLFSCDNVLPPLHPLSSSIFVVPGVYFSIAPSFLYCFFMSFSRFCSYCFSILFFHPLSSISFLNLLFTSPCFHFPLCFLFSSIEFLLFSQLALIYYPLFSPIIPSSPTTIFSIYFILHSIIFIHPVIFAISSLFFILLFAILAEILQAPQTAVPTHSKNLGEQLLWRSLAEPSNPGSPHPTFHREMCRLHRAHRWVMRFLYFFFPLIPIIPSVLSFSTSFMSFCNDIFFFIFFFGLF